MKTTLVTLGWALLAVGTGTEYNCADFVAPGSDNYCGAGREVNECPPFKIVDTLEDYQIREYPASWWTAHGTCQYDGQFWSLFRYITGSNADGVKIDMTAPVLMNHSQLKYQMIEIMQFYAPYKYQSYEGKTGAPLPAPTEEGVRNEQMPALKVAVRCFGGNTWWGASPAREEAALKGSLGRDKVKPKEFYYAGYDSPMKFSGRHNEIWALL